MYHEASSSGTAARTEPRLLTGHAKMSKRKGQSSDITKFFKKKSKPGTYKLITDNISNVQNEIFVGSQNNSDSTYQGADTTTVRVESESDDSVSENEGALVEAASISHVGSSSCSSSTFNIERQSIPIEYDIGKLQDSGVDIKGLS